MRPKEICTRTPLQHTGTVSVNGNIQEQREYGDVNGRIDQPIYLAIETRVDAGKSNLEIKIESGGELKTRCQAEVTLSTGEILLAHSQRLDGSLS